MEYLGAAYHFNDRQINSDFTINGQTLLFVSASYLVEYPLYLRQRLLSSKIRIDYVLLYFDSDDTFNYI